MEQKNMLTEAIYEADILCTNNFEGIPCSFPYIFNMVRRQGGTLNKIIATWFPNFEGFDGRTVLHLHVNNEIDQLEPRLEPIIARDRSLFQFQKIRTPKKNYEMIDSKENDMEFNTLKSSVEETGNTIKRLKAESCKLQGNVSSNKTKLSKLEKQNQSLEEMNKVLKEQNEILKSNNTKLNKSNSERKEQKKILKAENLSLEKKNNRLNKENEQLSQSNLNMNKEKKRWSTSKKSIKKELKEVNNKIEDKLIYLSKLKNDSDELNKNCNKVNEEIKKENKKLTNLSKYIEDRESLGKSLCHATEIQQNDLEKLKKEKDKVKKETQLIKNSFANDKSVSPMDLINQAAIDNLTNCPYLTGLRGKNIVATVINICQFIKNLTTNCGKKFLIESDVEMITKTFDILNTSESLISFPGDNVLDKMKQIEQFFESYIQKLGKNNLKKENFGDIRESIGLKIYFDILIKTNDLLKIYKTDSRIETMKKIIKAFTITDRLMKQYRSTVTKTIKERDGFRKDKEYNRKLYLTYKTFSVLLSGNTMLDIIFEEAYVFARDQVLKSSEYKENNYWMLIPKYISLFLENKMNGETFQDYSSNWGVTEKEKIKKNIMCSDFKKFSKKIHTIMSSPERLLRWYQYGTSIMFQDSSVNTVIQRGICVTLVNILTKNRYERFTEKFEQDFLEEFEKILDGQSIRHGIQEGILKNTSWMIINLSKNSKEDNNPMIRIIGRNSSLYFSNKNSETIINELLLYPCVYRLTVLAHNFTKKQLENMSEEEQHNLNKQYKSPANKLI
jgi:hypothetical protein